jgi:hypothetical protein
MSAVRFSAGRPARGLRATGLRVTPAVAVAAVLAGLAAGCASAGNSSPSSSPVAAGTSAASATPAATGKLTGAPAGALADKAIAGTKAAKSVRVSGMNIGTGTGNQHVTFDLTLVKDVGCTGTISLTAAETFKIIDTGGYVWLLPNSGFYASQHLSKSAQALLAGKYIKVKSTDRRIGTLGQICTFSGLFGRLPKVTGTGYTATPATYHGQPAYEITRAGKGGTAFVSNTSPLLLLQISNPQSTSGTITFTNYNTVTAINTPSAAETVDGSKLGI